MVGFNTDYEDGWSLQRQVHRGRWSDHHAAAPRCDAVCPRAGHGQVAVTLTVRMDGWKDRCSEADGRLSMLLLSIVMLSVKLQGVAAWL